MKIDSGCLNTRYWGENTDIIDRNMNNGALHNWHVHKKIIRLVKGGCGGYDVHFGWETCWDKIVWNIVANVRIILK